MKSALLKMEQSSQNESVQELKMSFVNFSRKEPFVKALKENPNLQIKTNLWNDANQNLKICMFKKGFQRFHNKMYKMWGFSLCIW